MKKRASSAHPLSSILPPSASQALLTFLLLFGIFRLASAVEISYYKKQPGCPLFSCGPLQGIRYPFRSKGDPPECGDRRYQLACVDNKTIWDIHRDGPYYVTNIYVNGSLRFPYYDVRAVDARLANGSCDLPLHSLNRSSVESMGWDAFAFTWATFVSCTSRIMTANNTYNHPVPCLSKTDAFHVYVMLSYRDALRLEDLEPSCSFLAMTPILFDEKQMKPLDENNNIILLENSTADVFQLLKLGFSVSFSAGFRRPSIHDCLEKAARNFLTTMYEGGILFWRFSFAYSELTFVVCLENHYEPLPGWVSYLLLILESVELILIALLILGRFVIAPLAIFVFLAHKFWRAKKSIDVVEKFLRNQRALVPTRYAYPDLIAMTSHFREKLGQGGYGSVSKGVLPGGVLVAVKMLNNSRCDGEEFISEVSTIGRIHHVNVVKLVGFCSEGSKRALVYEYMPHGSLDKYIFSSNRVAGRRPLTWGKLIEIALGIARGINYLHQGCDKRILHFDIKPQNILLDHNFTPKVSDFGLAKLYPKDTSLVSISTTRGTTGYIAPELISRSFGTISHKSDVYSFGMLLMEMAGGRRNVDPRVENSSQAYYPSWIYDRLTQPEISEISIAFDITETERKLCIIGLWCIQIRPSARPAMSKVIEMLEADVDTLEMPPKPFFSSEEPTPAMSRSRLDSSTELSAISEDE